MNYILNDPGGDESVKLRQYIHVMCIVHEMWMFDRRCTSEWLVTLWAKHQTPSNHCQSHVTSPHNKLAISFHPTFKYVTWVLRGMVTDDELWLYYIRYDQTLACFHDTMLTPIYLLYQSAHFLAALSSCMKSTIIWRTKLFVFALHFTLRIQISW